MNEEKLIDAVGFIEDALIEEAEAKRREKKRFPIAKAGLIAACFCVAVAASLFIYPYFINTAEPKEESYNAGEDASDNMPPPEAADGEEGYGAVGEENDVSSSGVDLENEGNNQTADDSSVAYVPLIVTVESFTDEGFICTVYDTGKSEYFADGDTLKAIFAENAEIPSEIKAGDRVFVTYSISENAEDTFIAHKVYYTEGETTPAYYGGKK